MIYEAVDSREIDFYEYLNVNKNTFFVFVTGSCKCEERTGSFRVALVYNQYARVYQEAVEDTASANYCMIKGIQEAIKHINFKEAKVCIVVAVALGFKQAVKGKGVNAQHIQVVYDWIEEKKGELYVLEVMSGGEKIKKMISDVEKQVYGLKY